MPENVFTTLRLRLTRTLVPIFEECRSALGIRRGIHAPPDTSNDRTAASNPAAAVYYKELTPERLMRALSKRGTGHKDYRVTFPDGSKQIIRCSAQRCYADLMGFEGHYRYTRLCALLRPGSRVLEIAGPPYATGYTSALLARSVGQSGAVVSLLGDAQGAQFAQKRYRLANLSIESHLAPGAPETGDPMDALIGETDGAFDAIICIQPRVTAARLPGLAADLWRVLRPGGFMIIGVARGQADVLDAALTQLAQTLQADATLLSEERGPDGTTDEPWDTSDALFRKPIAAAAHS